MNPMNHKEVQLILKQLKIQPSKFLGQNFLTDKNLVKKIISISDLSHNDIILEIGPGLGAITEELIKLAKKVYSIEIDSRLCSYLEDKFSIYDNIEIIHGDILKIQIPDNNKVVSNIPYKITGPIIDRIFFRINSPIGVLIIEKSISDRLFISGDYDKFSRISIGVNTFMVPTYQSYVSRKVFYPIPKIALSLIKLVPKNKVPSFFLKKEAIDFFLRFISGIMPYKNKNIANAIDLFFKTQKDTHYTKKEILMTLQKNNYDNKKVFEFEIDEYAKISKLFYS